MNETTATPGTQSNQLRKAIIQKVIQIYQDSPTLSDDEIVALAEAKTKSLFDQMQQGGPPTEVSVPTTSQLPLAATRVKKKSREDRTDHVSRFFLTIAEKQLREEGVHNCLIPVFAKSIQGLIEEESYVKFSQKINQLLSFATQKGFDYDQALQSKPGKQISADLMTLYRSEMLANPRFGEQLRNKLDQALVQNIKKLSAKNPDVPLDIEGTISKSFKSFIKAIGPVTPPQPKKK